MLSEILPTNFSAHIIEKKISLTHSLIGVVNHVMADLLGLPLHPVLSNIPQTFLLDIDR